MFVCVISAGVTQLYLEGKLMEISKVVALVHVRLCFEEIFIYLKEMIQKGCCVNGSPLLNEAHD